jgi:hypothetical protein
MASFDAIWCRDNEPNTGKNELFWTTDAIRVLNGLYVLPNCSFICFDPNLTRTLWPKEKIYMGYLQRDGNYEIADTAYQEVKWFKQNFSGNIYLYER